MKILKLLVCFNVILVLSIANIKAQEKITIKTTEFYKVELPKNSTHKDIFVTWSFDIANKRISYRIPNLGLDTFNYSTVEVSPNSTNENTILNFKNSQEQMTLIMKGDNYFKIMLYTDLDSNSKGITFESLKVYSNYLINDFSELLSFW